MEIKNIKIINFKGFKECDITFHLRINVFIGSNASGKTTLLTALLKSIYSITQHFAHLQVNSEIVALTNEDINYSARFCYIKTIISKFPEYNNDIETAIYLNSLPDNLEAEKKMVERRKYEFISWFQNRVRNGPITVPIIKFYPSNRGNIKYSEPLHWDKYPISQLETWSNIYLNTVSYSKFFHWFFENETNELRLQRDYKDFNVQNPTLQNVRKALSKAFEHIGYRNIRIKTKQFQRAGTSKMTPNLVLENEETKQDEFIDYKSDGERALITLVADIAYNLSLAKDFTNDDDFLTSPGVVIIDEIETHLHPNWQRQLFLF